MAESSGRTAADMLRNTPSNIRRLIDEIQQCEGRLFKSGWTADTCTSFDMAGYENILEQAGQTGFEAKIQVNFLIVSTDYERLSLRIQGFTKSMDLDVGGKHKTDKNEECLRGNAFSPHVFTRLNLYLDISMRGLHVQKEVIEENIETSAFNIDIDSLATTSASNETECMGPEQPPPRHVTAKKDEASMVATILPTCKNDPNEYNRVYYVNIDNSENYTSSHILLCKTQLSTILHSCGMAKS
ncbi:hypothetical protein Tco_1161044 [Tanacetum coccineum]